MRIQHVLNVHSFCISCAFNMSHAHSVCIEGAFFSCAFNMYWMCIHYVLYAHSMAIATACYTCWHTSTEHKCPVECAHGRNLMRIHCVLSAHSMCIICAFNMHWMHMTVCIECAWHNMYVLIHIASINTYWISCAFDMYWRRMAVVAAMYPRSIARWNLQNSPNLAGFSRGQVTSNLAIDRVPKSLPHIFH